MSKRAGSAARPAAASTIIAANIRCRRAEAFHPPLEGGSKSSLSDSEKRISGRGNSRQLCACPSPKNFPLRSNFSTLPQGEGGKNESRQEHTMEQHPKQLLHLVFGGELVSPDKVEFKDLSKVQFVGIY